LNKLVSIKKVTNFKAVPEVQVKMNFVVKAESAEDHKQIEYKVYLMCDSYNLAFETAMKIHVV
jgi:hypothetical protein